MWWTKNKKEEKPLSSIDWDKVKTVEDIKIIFRAVVAKEISFYPSNKRLVPYTKEVK